jgi:hypothetical protein
MHHVTKLKHLRLFFDSSLDSNVQFLEELRTLINGLPLLKTQLQMIEFVGLNNYKQEHSTMAAQIVRLLGGLDVNRFMQGLRLHSIYTDLIALKD